MILVRIIAGLLFLVCVGPWVAVGAVAGVVGGGFVIGWRGLYGPLTVRKQEGRHEVPGIL